MEVKVGEYYKEIWEPFNIIKITKITNNKVCFFEYCKGKNSSFYGIKTIKGCFTHKPQYNTPLWRTLNE